MNKTGDNNSDLKSVKVNIREKKEYTSDRIKKILYHSSKARFRKKSINKSR